MSEITAQKPFFIWSCILHVVILLGLILSVSFSGSAATSSPSQPSIIQAVAVSSQALTQYKNTIIQKQQAMVAQQQAAQLAAQKAVAEAVAEKRAAEKAAEAKAVAEKEAAMKQAIQKQLKESMEKQLAHTPPPPVSKSTTASKSVTQNKSTTQNKSVTQTKSTATNNSNPGLSDKYKAAIIQAISEQWLVPQNLPKNILCVLDIRVAPGGVVLDVTVKKSSGNPVLDNSAMAAVKKASPLPVPTDPSLFDAFRTITLTVKPDGSLLEG